MNNIIEFNNVTVTSHNFFILRDVSITFSEGEFVTVLGPNGAGKTTFVKCITGLQKITSGEIKIFGTNIKNCSLTKIRKKIGYVPQHFNIDYKFPCSVIDVVSIGRFGVVGLFNRLTQKDKEIISLSLDMVGISNLAYKPIGHISGGELQKVSIARVLAQQPQIMIFDEPTSNLDLKSQDEIVKIIEKIYYEKKVTVIFITHFLSHIPFCSKKIVLMKNGKITISGNPDEVLKENYLSNLYDCEVEITELNGKKHFHVIGKHLV
jgi:ABC-type cobalamin/Fe3+-siderophores transport system ATPase subunit